MTFDDNSTFTLSSGRTFRANCGIIGLAPDSHNVSEGYDRLVFMAAEPGGRPAWTPAERAELANFMIALWEAWKTGVAGR